MKKLPEVIFSTSVEYKWGLRSKGYSIRPNAKDSNIDAVTLERQIKDIIAEKLPSEMKSIFGIDIKTRIITTQYGSITVFFGVIVAGIGMIAGYKDFYDSIQLIQKQSRNLIGSLLMHYSDDIEFSVSIEHPQLPEPASGRLFRRLRKNFDIMPEELEEVLNYNLIENAGRKRRDGFFWYLLAMNVVLLGVVAVLVGRAVLKVYFP